MGDIMVVLTSPEDSFLCGQPDSAGLYFTRDEMLQRDACTWIDARIPGSTLELFVSLVSGSSLSWDASENNGTLSWQTET